MRGVVTTYFKALSRCWCEYTDENCRNVTLGGVSVAFVTQTEYLTITSLGVYRCVSFMLLIIIIIIIIIIAINILNRIHTHTHSLTHSLTTYYQILLEELKQN